MFVSPDVCCLKNCKLGLVIFSQKFSTIKDDLDIPRYNFSAALLK